MKNKERETYVKLFRRILDWEWYEDTNTFRLFMHILLNANYTPSRYKGYDIPEGACVFGYHSWSKQLNLSIQQLRTALDHLKSTGEITIKSTNKFSIVTLENWELWQIAEGRPTSKSTNKQQTSNKQVTTSKEDKNIKKKDIYRSEFEELWKLYPKKQGKDRAFDCYMRARKSGTTYEEVEHGILSYTNFIAMEERNLKYVKQGSTFFSQKAWLDDWSIKPKREKNTNPFIEMLKEGDY